MSNFEKCGHPMESENLFNDGVGTTEYPHANK